jgi:hypothetical protein
LTHRRDIKMAVRGIFLQQDVTLKNVFHLVLTDGRTGKVKQEAWAYNHILNQGFDKIVRAMGQTAYTECNGTLRFMRPSTDTSTGKDVKLGGYIHIGTGTGTLAVTRTQLFTFLAARYSTFHARGINEAAWTAYYTQRATWTEAEHQNTTIREVGLGSYSLATDLSTHALIEDSEGNPIALAKGAWDVLTVYSTVYIELSHSYDNFSFITGSHATQRNVLLDKVYRNTSVNMNTSLSPTHLFEIRYGRSSAAVASSNLPVLTEITRHNLAKTGTHISYNTANKRVDINQRLAAASGNHADGIWEIGVAWLERSADYDAGFKPTTYLFRSVMPVAGVWEGRQITGENMGTGDGSQTVFTARWKPIKAGTTPAVYLDTVLQASGYTINMTTGAVTFDAAPGSGVAVTIDYYVQQIPKDSDHVLDVTFRLQFADGNAA